VAVGLPGLSQHPPVVGERGWLRAFLTLEVDQPLPGQLSERDPAPPALISVALEERLGGVVLAHELQHVGRGLGLREDARGSATVGVASHRRRLALPSAPERPHNGLAVA
jgi:hypothetical protein